MGVYPFMFGSTKDFEPIVNEMVEVRNTSARIGETMLMTV